jgi:hypothetical protein
MCGNTTFVLYQAHIEYLSNDDIVDMIKAGIGAETVISEIRVAVCSFETSPTALIELKHAGLPDSVILAMVQAPKN